MNLPKQIAGHQNKTDVIPVQTGIQLITLIVTLASPLSGLIAHLSPPGSLPSRERDSLSLEGRGRCKRGEGEILNSTFFK